ncbi:universal stress protein [Streptomyces sindenensis]|uniref:universal stress protein n=1 Tax=Streptomyces sindenensis TaxID=67363 RepID=UPI001679975A|nr:universal stress protein [Streptomyces sindenensis]GGP59577.1 universal stress protein [Streptomyces sindenensis]
MNLPLIVGVDGSEPSLRAVDWAADEAVLRRASLRIVYASLWERYEGPALAPEVGGTSGRVAAEDILAAAARRALRHHAELPVTTADVLEEPEYALVREGRDASAVVVGTRGRSGLADLLLGSVSLTVAARADCPVVVIRGNHNSRAVGGGQDHIVVGVADAPTAAVRFAYEEAKRRGAALEAVRAWRCPRHETVGHPLLTGGPERLHEERAAKELEEALADAPLEVRLRRRTAEGPAHGVLLAASRDAGLLIVGRRRPGRLGPHLGRVAHTVLHHSGCPVVVVPEPE